MLRRPLIIFVSIDKIERKIHTGDFVDMFKTLFLTLCRSSLGCSLSALVLRFYFFLFLSCFFFEFATRFFFAHFKAGNF